MHLVVYFPNAICWRDSFSQCIVLLSLLMINWPYKCGFISGPSILFHWTMGLLLCRYHTVLITTSLYYISKSGIVITPVLFFFLFWTYLKVIASSDRVHWFKKPSQILVISGRKIFFIKMTIRKHWRITKAERNWTRIYPGEILYLQQIFAFDNFSFFF